MPSIENIQKELRSAGLDGWLFYDFHHRDPIAARVLGLNGGMGTRRWFYLIPSRGTPRKLVHRIEAGALDTLPGQTLVYSSLDELNKNLPRLIGRARKVAMQYSPRNAIPYVSMVDAGTVEMVRAQRLLGGEFGRSGAAIRGLLEPGAIRVASGSGTGHRSHRARSLRARRRAGSRAKPILRNTTCSSGFSRKFRESSIISDEPPIVAVGPHSGNPHYEPTAASSSPIREGDLLLLDVWGKLQRPGSVYYDITWVGYLGAEVPRQYRAVFEIVRAARDGAIAFVRESVGKGRKIKGWQVDAVARRIISDAGYAKNFVHRTGHSIGQEVHGNGANMDGLETHDSRTILPHTCFSIEPGIYLKEFGIRSEVDVYTEGREARVTGAVQTEILPLLAK